MEWLDYAEFGRARGRGGVWRVVKFICLTRERVCALISGLSARLPRDQWSTLLEIFRISCNDDQIVSERGRADQRINGGRGRPIARALGGNRCPAHGDLAIHRKNATGEPRFEVLCEPLFKLRATLTLCKQLYSDRTFVSTRNPLIQGQ